MRVLDTNIEGIYIKYRDRVFAVGFNYFRNSMDADDVVQETFLKLLRSNKDFESEEHLRNWIMKVAVNECKRVTLSSWFKRRESLEEYADKLVFEEVGDRDLFDKVMRLPKNYRQVTHLFYYEGYSVKEIAGILGIRETTVTTRLSRARKKLKDQLKGEWEDE
ncbi:MAG: sigma-70 family RNA polymerase sigma factor [Firmicutes bacterium]|nr:sigma-70 family RNA polymerase sigma factor [Bacillota bacterium]MBQ1689698.1 sigma-70 family RNA polymerase sigma factor [Bacillota bacterium]MBQ1736116.1 sigma-70 family RNA polymerase sigma factor [Lachnospiraceae bacterium]